MDRKFYNYREVYLFRISTTSMLRPLALVLLFILVVSGCVQVEPVSDEAEILPKIQGAQIPVPLTLEGAVNVALRNDHQLRADRHRISIEYYRKVEQALLANPTVSYSAIPAEWTLKLITELGALIDLGGKRQLHTDRAQTLENQAVLSVLLRQIELTEQVRVAFYKVLTLHRIEDLLKKRYELVKSVMRIAQKRQDLGDISTLDIIGYETASQQAVVELRNTRAQRIQWEGKLNKLLGEPITKTVILDRPFVINNAIAEIDADKVNDLGKVKRPEIAIITAKIQEHTMLLESAKITWIPQIYGGPVITRPGEDEDITAGGTISVTLPIFNWGQERQGIETATLKALEEELLAMEAQVLLNLHNSILKVCRTRDKLMLELPKQLDQAQREHHITQTSFKLGNVSEIDVLSSRIRELEIKIRLEKVQGAYWEAIAATAAALGDSGNNDNSK